ncbi:hypothetical protein [Tateyamaria sp. SN6-1]|uniref:hypothetical protein n=1 Tax=Tateyamaria sp. SN6-1 TaxID=3092148 RepID=UPI0039F5A08B
MKQLIPAFVITAALAACDSPISSASGPTGPELPPLGLASTAIWLEEREALTTRGAQRATEIQSAQRTQEIRTGERPVPVAAAPARAQSAGSNTALNVDQVANRLLAARAPGEAATIIFVEACLKTAASPDAAASVLKRLGFKERRARNNRTEFTSSFVTATLSQDTRGSGFGQCTVTPRNAGFAQVLPVFLNDVRASGVPVTQLPGENAFVIGNTGAVALISGGSGAMTRTQPGVFRG